MIFLYLLFSLWVMGFLFSYMELYPNDPEDSKLVALGACLVWPVVAVYVLLTTKKENP